VAQAAQAFGEALNNGSAGGVIAEMGLNPTGLGVEPFLRALQAATPAADAMETEAPKPDAEKKDDSMDESIRGCEVHTRCRTSLELEA